MTSWLSKGMQFISDRPYGAGAALYVLAALAITQWGLHHSSSKPHYVATHVLVGNHRILMSDIKRPMKDLVSRYGFYMDPVDSVLGKYLPLGTRIERGEPIKAETLADVADLSIPDDMIRVALPLSTNPGVLGLLDAGSTVLLLQTEQPPAQSVTPVASGTSNGSLSQNPTGPNAQSADSCGARTKTRATASGKAAASAKKVLPPSRPAAPSRPSPPPPAAVVPVMSPPILVLPPAPIQATVHAIVCDPAPAAPPPTAPTCFAILRVFAKDAPGAMKSQKLLVGVSAASPESAHGGGK